MISFKKYMIYFMYISIEKHGKHLLIFFPVVKSELVGLTTTINSIHISNCSSRR